MTTKRCSRCREVKSESEFYKKNDTRDGLQMYCKPCIKAYRQQRAEAQRATCPGITVAGPVGAKLCCTCEEWKISNSFYAAPRNNDGYQGECKECKNVRQRQYYADNKERVSENRRRWRATEDGKTKINNIAKRWINDRYHNDEIFRKAHLIRTRLSHAWKWFETRGEHRVSKSGDIDFADIFDHMGDIPTDGHYGKPYDEHSYSIDHIVDLRSWDLTDEVEFKAATHPLNHRWMVRRANYDRIWDDGYDVERHREYLISLVSPEDE